MLVGAFNYLICNYFTTAAAAAVTAVAARKTTKAADDDAAAAAASGRYELLLEKSVCVCSFLIASLVFK